MAVTIKELSKKCGLSVSTVSKALNGYSDISAATKAAVIAAAREIGYYPNAHARALKTKRSYNLGVLFVDDSKIGFAHSYFSTMLESFKKEAEHNGYDITFISHNIAENRMTYLEHCHYREVDGVCVACVNFLDPEVGELVASELPVVTVDHLFHNRSCIQSDNRAGVQMLIEYIHSRGHSKIAFIHGKKSTVTDTRMASFYRAMETYALPVPESYIGECEFNNPASAFLATRKMLELPERPTCILMSDDNAAIGAMEAITDAGLVIGKDVSIAGYDGIELSQLIRPRLTTIRQDTTRIGAEAARALVNTIENPRTAIPEIMVIPCSLIEGETVGRI